MAEASGQVQAREVGTHEGGRPPVQIPDVETILLEDLHARVRAAAERSLRFVTATCLDGGDNFELYYHFADGVRMSHLRVVVRKGVSVPSISGIYLCAFLVENEISELFGLPITDIAIDYKGRLLLNEDGPVTPMLKNPPALPA